MLLPFLLAQTAVQMPRETIDLTIAQPCQEARTDAEVVVCAKRGDSPYRLRDAPPAKRQALPDAKLTIADGVSVAAETEGAEIGGFASNRMMVRFKLKF